MTTTFSFPAFQPHPWLSHAHAQTIYGTIFPRRFEGAATWRETGEPREFMLPDGDRLTAVLHRHPDDPSLTRPLVVLLHGLEGCVDSHYVVGMATKAHALGFHALRLNYRGCGDTEHLSRRLYNGFLIADVDHVLRALAAEAPWPLVPIGVSLGANMVLRLMGTYGDDPPPALLGAIAISPPIDFHLTSRAFGEGLNRGYDAFFLRKLKRKLKRTAALNPHDTALAERARRAGSLTKLRAFDELVTAPEGGFKDASDYYTHASTGDLVGAIRVPTLILHAEDDPLIPMAMFQDREALIAGNPALTTVFTPRGGHVGFFEAPGRRQPEPWMDAFWAENAAVAYVRWLTKRPNPSP